MNMIYKNSCLVNFWSGIKTFLLHWINLMPTCIFNRPFHLFSNKPRVDVNRILYGLPSSNLFKKKNYTVIFVIRILCCFHHTISPVNCSIGYETRKLRWLSFLITFCMVKIFISTCVRFLIDVHFNLI